MLRAWMTLPFYVIEEGLAESHFGFVTKPYISTQNIYLTGQNTSEIGNLNVQGE